MADEEDVDAAKADAQQAEENVAETEDQAAADHSDSAQAARGRADEAAE